MSLLLNLLISVGSAILQVLSTLDVTAFKFWIYEPKAPKSLL